MVDGHRRGVTRGYVWGLIFAVAIAVVALLIASWGLLALVRGGSGPVSTPGIGLGAASLIVAFALAALVWGLWSQSLQLLRGRKAAPWGHIVVLGAGGYLIWCLGGLLAGLSIGETWLSPYAAALAVVWALGSLLCWAVLLRRVYTDRPTPQWPWEKRGEPGPDWIGENPWSEDPRDDESDGRDGGAR